MTIRKAKLQEHLRGRHVADYLHDELLYGEEASRRDRSDPFCSFLIARVSIPHDALPEDLVTAEACEGVSFVFRVSRAAGADGEVLVVVTERSSSLWSGLFLAFSLDSFMNARATPDETASRDLQIDDVDTHYGIPIVCDLRSCSQDADKLYKKTKFGIRFLSEPLPASAAQKQIFFVDEVPGLAQGIRMAISYESISERCIQDALQKSSAACSSENDSVEVLDERTESEDNLDISASESPQEYSPSEAEDVESSDCDKTSEREHLTSNAYHGDHNREGRNEEGAGEKEVDRIEKVGNGQEEDRGKEEKEKDGENARDLEAKEEEEEVKSQICEDVPADFQCDDLIVETSDEAARRARETELLVLKKIHSQFRWVGECVKEEKERKYYEAVMLKEEEKIGIGSTVKLIAPKGHPYFLARVLELWENVADGFKMMRCNWFYSSFEVHCSDPRHPKEVFASDHYDEQYLTTISTTCNIVHKSGIPPGELARFVKEENNFFYEQKYFPTKKLFVAVPQCKEIHVRQAKSGGADLSLKNTANPQPPRRTLPAPYKGIERNADGTYRAIANINGSKISYSPFKSAKLAARAYDLMMCKETTADDPCLNFAQDHKTIMELQEILALSRQNELVIPVRSTAKRRSSIIILLNNSDSCKITNFIRHGSSSEVIINISDSIINSSSRKITNSIIVILNNNTSGTTTIFDVVSDQEHNSSCYHIESFGSVKRAQGDPSLADFLWESLYQLPSSSRPRPLRPTRGGKASHDPPTLQRGAFKTSAIPCHRVRHPSGRHVKVFDSCRLKIQTDWEQEKEQEQDWEQEKEQEQDWEQEKEQEQDWEKEKEQAGCLSDWVMDLCKVIEGRSIMIGDQVVAIGKHAVQGMETAEIENLLCGPVDSCVQLKMRRRIGMTTADYFVTVSFMAREDRELSRLLLHSHQGIEKLMSLKEEAKVSRDSHNINGIQRILDFLLHFKTTCASFATAQQAYETGWQRALEGENIELRQIRSHKEQMDKLAGDIRSRSRSLLAAMRTLVTILSKP
ncbi:hypothetical protein GUITHDRAFT_119146 [Guillardia theta CCMP2712]|uniref:BAH domain-containing protein n=1 Tax=Guillardia theta (strain CCMP2712) TaxID=905079 RepID=L1IF55_GUITC|nr:hypothetical protein GUITHDRAFT_119146 [Guillardia theta CCMP2712]EKX34712.1 hypothetical protein GUITHDRAFT_119146 [Guillardia theta CCMP2712]|eukprot:XP_005821692.1 hypothetical protein GUITHDRAFT_119146 [Guillardia theta CCMP2712]